jgi:hypothetical protein
MRLKSRFTHTSCILATSTLEVCTIYLSHLDPPKCSTLTDEDIATLDTPTLWSFPSCNSSPTQLPRHPRIQQTRRHCFGHNSFIWHQNGAFLDTLERGWRHHHFGLVPALEGPWIILCDHVKVLRHLFGPTWPCIVSSLKPKLWAPNP